MQVQLKGKNQPSVFWW